MYRCKNCGNLFEDGEQATWEESHGLDCPPYEKADGCPNCHGEYEEVEPCAICGGYDGNGLPVCDECIQRNTTVERCFEASENVLDEIVLNSFLLYVFSRETIEEILFDALLKMQDDEHIQLLTRNYVADEKEWFATKLLKSEVKE